MCGVYPVGNARVAGTEISSTYEGRHITVREDELKHPVNAGGWVDKGDPVILCQAGVQANFGKAVGVAMNDGAAAADLIAVDTEGIWVQSVVADDDAGAGIAVVPGDQLFINTTTCIISKIRNIATQIPFGYALGDIAAGLTLTIAVKVHFDPMLDSERILYNTVTSGAYGKQTVGILAAGHSEGIAHYFSSQVGGQQDGLIYGVGSWIDIGADFVGTNAPLTPHETGVWDGQGGDISLSRIIFAGQHQAILAAAPAQLYAWRLNVAAAAGGITALIAAANPATVGYIAAVTEADPPIGYIPLADVVGIGVVYVRVYADTD